MNEIEIENIQQWLKENWTGFGSKMDYILYDFYQEYQFSDIYFDLRQKKLNVSCKAKGIHIPVKEYDIDSNEIRETINIMRKNKDQFIYKPVVIKYNGSFRSQYSNDMIVLRVVPSLSGPINMEFNEYMVEKIKLKNRLEIQLSLYDIKEDEINMTKI